MPGLPLQNSEVVGDSWWKDHSFITWAEEQHLFSSHGRNLFATLPAGYVRQCARFGGICCSTPTGG